MGLFLFQQANAVASNVLQFLVNFFFMLLVITSYSIHYTKLYESGQADVILAGGQENMSMVPMALPKARWGHRMELTGIGEVYDLMVFDGLYEIFYGYHMGLTAENIAEKYGITREEQDYLSVLSHTRARKAITDSYNFV